MASAAYGRTFDFPRIYSLLLFFALMFVFSSSSSAKTSSYQPATVRLVVGGREAPFLVPPYLGSDGQVYAPAEAVYLLGAQFKTISGSKISITSASGKTFEAASYKLSDRMMISMIPVAQQLGASIDWDKSARVLDIRAKILEVKIDSNKLIVATSYPVEYATGSLSNPRRDYVDLFGTDLGTEATSLPARADGVNQIRSNQMSKEIVRIALDLTTTPKMATYHGPKVSVIEAPLDGERQYPLAPPSAIAIKPTPEPINNPSGSQLKIVKLEYLPNSPDGPVVVITTTGKLLENDSLTNEWIDSPYRFAVDLPEADIDIPGSDETGSIEVDNQNIKDARWGYYKSQGTTYGRIVLDARSKTNLRVIAETAPDGSWKKYSILLDPNRQVSGVVPIPPSVPGGIQQPAPPTGVEPGSGQVSPIPIPKSMIGMVVIVDPGHGGHDTGAPGKNPLLEKNLTLSIGLKVRDEFLAAGAKPIMTRNDDTFIPLPDRSQIGIDDKASLFISIHCDSSPIHNFISGSTVYYHARNAESKNLAAAIAAQLNASNCGIESRGARTDYALYPGVGLSVLRRSPETAVLVECGYINNDSDAAIMQKNDAQEAIAKAIVAGVADYIASKGSRR